jgi:hypothetical protein
VRLEQLTPLSAGASGLQSKAGFEPPHASGNLKLLRKDECSNAERLNVSMWSMASIPRPKMSVCQLIQSKLCGLNATESEQAIQMSLSATTTPIFILHSSGNPLSSSVITDDITIKGATDPVQRSK